MTELDRAWAETQIEGMADGSLSAEAEQRMLAAMRQDRGLADRVDQARALRFGLRQLGNAPVPRGLFGRLWRIPAAGRSHASTYWMPAGVLAAAVVAAISIGIFQGQQAKDVASMDEAEMAAVQDVVIAVSYLQKSMVLAHNEINEVVGSGVFEALAASSGMMNRTERIDSEGDRQDVD